MLGGVRITSVTGDGAYGSGKMRADIIMKKRIELITKIRILSNNGKFIKQDFNLKLLFKEQNSHRGSCHTRAMVSVVTKHQQALGIATNRSVWTTCSQK
jgi:hypothetical protein